MATLPKIINISEVDKTNLNFKMLHFTKAQWQKATAEITFSDDASMAPKHGLVLRAIPDPNGDVTISPICHEQSPGTTCIVKSKLNPDGSLSMQCQCKPSGRSTPSPPGGGPVTLPDCFVRYVKGKLSCGELACKNKCTLKGIHIPLSSVSILYCACQA